MTANYSSKQIETRMTSNQIIAQFRHIYQKNQHKSTGETFVVGIPKCTVHYVSYIYIL